MEKLIHRMAMKKGGLPCPHCGKEHMTEFRVNVVTCPACGYRGSRTEWSMRSLGKDEEEQRADPDAPPADTKIVRKKINEDTIAWEIPPSGKGGGLLAFGVLWTGFICFWTVGTTIGAMKEGGGAWLMPLFSIPFWAAGIGMLYYALRTKYAFHLIMIDSKTVVMARSFFSTKTSKSLLRSTLKSAEKKEFYQQNYTPVYGVQIKGDDGKIRFGTMLSEEEKNWLVADFQRVLWPERVAEKTPSLLSVTPSDNISSPPRPLKPFSIDFPPASAKGSVLGTTIGFLMVGIFLVIGIFFLKEAGFFRWIWLTFNSLFAIAMICFTVMSWRNRTRIVRVSGDRSGIHVETRRGRVPVKSETMAETEGVEVRSYRSGSSNDTTMVRIELVGKDEVLTLLKWYPEDAARKPVAQLKKALSGQSF